MRKILLASAAILGLVGPAMANSTFNHTGVLVFPLGAPGSGGCAQFQVQGDATVYFAFEEDVNFPYSWSLLLAARTSESKPDRTISFRTGGTPAPAAAQGCLDQGFVYVPHFAY